MERIRSTSIHSFIHPDHHVPILNILGLFRRPIIDNLETLSDGYYTGAIPLESAAPFIQKQIFSYTYRRPLKSPNFETKSG
ncbi:uncharacterized protein BO96DRAFT_410783 [Aspergillus niger CBS 101883]|nr:uncharacterized protein BO96DRAFT_410783 [Aspergillus niger CBS 101883]PYH57901.1 hypothetical protein BO96DRAFT_410783 [Aspergillus niger CBS 101883]RDH17925.1 hypothetical protein M747DRAFT_297608 [Aspergillus niger ATCC 13496]